MRLFVVKEKALGDCLVCGVARYVLGDPTLVSPMRLLFALAVRDIPDRDQVMVPDFTLPQAVQRNDALEDNMEYIVSPGKYIDQLELAAFMHQYNLYRDDNGEEKEVTFIWQVNEDENVEAVLAGPPKYSIPDDQQYHGHGMCLLYRFFANPQKCHWDTVTPTDPTDRLLPLSVKCTYCEHQVEEWFELTSRENQGKVSCAGCRGNKSGRWHRGTTNDKENKLCKDMFENPEKLKKEVSDFILLRIAQRRVDKLSSMQKTQRKTTIGVVRYFLSEVMLRSSTRLNWFNSQELQLSVQFGGCVVCYRADPADGTEPHFMDGSFERGFFHIDTVLERSISTIMALAVQDPTIFRSPFDFNFDEYFIQWDKHIFPNAVMASGQAVMAKSSCPEAMAAKVMNNKQKDDGLKIILGFAANAAQRLFTAISGATTDAAPCSKTSIGDVKSFFAKTMHARPHNVDADAPSDIKRLVYFGLSWFFGGKKLSPQDEITARNMRDGSHTNARQSSETTLQCELVEDMAAGTSIKNREKAFLRQITKALIEHGYREGHVSEKNFGSEQAEMKEDSAEALRRSVRASTGDDVPSWGALLRVCDGEDTQNVWKTDGDIVTFMVCVLCATIVAHEPWTAFEAKRLIIQKQQASKAAKKATPYVDAGKLLGYKIWNRGLDGVCGNVAMAKAQAIELQAWSERYQRYIFAFYEEAPNGTFETYKGFTNVLVYSWARSFAVDGEASDTVRAIWKILGTMSFEISWMLTLARTVDVHKRQRFPDNLREFIYLLTHCVLCLCEYGTVAFDTHDKRPGGFCKQYSAMLYSWAHSFMVALTMKFNYPVMKSLHAAIETEFEIFAEIALILLLLEPNNTLTPRAMGITPLIVYQIMNDHLMTPTGEFTKDFLSTLDRANHYTVGHHYITFAFLRAACERASLRQSHLIPKAAVRRHAWLERLLKHTKHPTNPEPFFERGRFIMVLEPHLFRKIEEFVVAPSETSSRIDLTGD